MLTDFSKHGIDQTVEEWGRGFWDLYGRWFPDADNFGCAGASFARRSQQIPEIMLVKLLPWTHEGRCASTVAFNPLTDNCGVVINKGQDGILLPAWAWQTMLMFRSDITKGKSAEEKNRLDALLRVALAPVSSRTDSHTSWANAVASVSYLTHMGPVDIAKVEQADHSFNGLIKVSGFPDKTNQGTVWEFPLPTSVG